MGASGLIGAGAGLLGATAKAVLPTVAGAAATSVLNRKPGVPAPTTMPDPLAQEQARRQAIMDQLARRGRASTILTDTAPSGGKLGG
jgi:hypothetical protein